LHNVSFFCSYLNSGPHSCQAGALPLESLHQPFFVLGIFEIGSHNLFAWTGFKPRFSISASQVARITDISHSAWFT
jgi:hypothetical protein